VRTLAEVDADLARAKSRLQQLRHEKASIVVKEASCSLCGRNRGWPCTKPSGVATFPHAERVRAAKKARA